MRCGLATRPRPRVGEWLLNNLGCVVGSGREIRKSRVRNVVHQSTSIGSTACAAGDAADRTGGAAADLLLSATPHETGVPFGLILLNATLRDS
jgi:hypothetical protein